MNPRYMIDLATYRQMHSNESELPPQHDDLGQQAMVNDEPPEDPFVLLLPANILGFGFHDKKWSKAMVPALDSIVHLLIRLQEACRWSTSARFNGTNERSNV